MGRTFIFALTLVAFSSFPCPSATAQGAYGDVILKVATREGFGLAQILPDLQSAPLVFFGERHTDADHHALQLRTLRALSDRGVAVAVGLEMFRFRDQGVLDKWVRGELTEEQFIPLFTANWGNTWGLYRDIFIFARDRGVPMLGLNVPSEITEQVKAKGFYSLGPEQIAELPGVSCDYDERYMRFIRTVLGMHGQEAEGERFTRFCEAQMVWDSTMAYRLADYVLAHPGTVVLVLAGSSHAWKHGIPAQTRKRAPEVGWRVVLPEVPVVLSRERIGVEDADYLWLLKGFSTPPNGMEKPE